MWQKQEISTQLVTHTLTFLISFVSSRFQHRNTLGMHFASSVHTGDFQY